MSAVAKEPASTLAVAEERTKGYLPRILAGFGQTYAAAELDVGSSGEEV